VPIVETVRAVQKTLPLYRQYLGQTTAVNPIEIRPQVTGLLRGIAFREGSIVKKGQLLFTIDPRPYEAAMNEAKAKLAQAQSGIG
jgi:membrane fusion protein, multidrug efflux system